MELYKINENIFFVNERRSMMTKHILKIFIFLLSLYSKKSIVLYL